MARSKKPTWYSKIVWVQIISVILDLAVLAADSAFITLEQKAKITLGIAILTIIFRHLSKGEALTLKV